MDMTWVCELSWLVDMIELTWLTPLLSVQLWQVVHSIQRHVTRGKAKSWAKGWDVKITNADTCKDKQLCHRKETDKRNLVETYEMKSPCLHKEGLLNLARTSAFPPKVSLRGNKSQPWILPRFQRPQTLPCIGACSCYRHLMASIRSIYLHPLIKYLWIGWRNERSNFDPGKKLSSCLDASSMVSQMVV